MMNERRIFELFLDYWNTIVHRQKFGVVETFNASYQGLRPILNSRYWTTSPYEGNYFNDFIFYALKQEILRRVIINGMCGSFWHFKRFILLSVKVLDNDAEAVV